MFICVHLCEKRYDGKLVRDDNANLTQLREVEVDRVRNVYVLNCRRDNSSDILWVYSSDTAPPSSCDLQSLEIPITAPTGLCISSDGSRVYLASCENAPDANSVKLYVLSCADLSLKDTIEIREMGHITDVAEDAGTICVVGFLMPEIPSHDEFLDVETILSGAPIYQPRVAVIPPGHTGPVEATCPTDAASAIHMALPLSAISTGDATRSHNTPH